MALFHTGYHNVQPVFFPLQWVDEWIKSFLIFRKGDYSMKWRCVWGICGEIALAVIQLTNLSPCSSSIFMWIRAGESVENSNYFKSLPKRDLDSLNHWHGLHHCTICILHKLQEINSCTISVSWGSAVRPLPWIGMEKHRNFQRSEKKVCCGAGNWKSC